MAKISGFSSKWLNLAFSMGILRQFWTEISLILGFFKRSKTSLFRGFFIVVKTDIFSKFSVSCSGFFGIIFFAIVLDSFVSWSW